MTNWGPAPCSLSNAALYSAFRSASSRTAAPARILCTNQCSPLSLGLFKFLALLCKTKSPPFFRAPGLKPLFMTLVYFVASSESMQIPARSLSFCAPEERQRSEPAAPGTRRSMRKLRPTTPVAARGISPRERSEPPTQPGGFSMQSGR